MGNRVLDAALKYAALGWRVFPCKPGSKEPACNWKSAATSDPDKLKDLFADESLNIAWAVPEDMMVLDIDLKSGVDGFASHASLEGHFGSLPASPIQVTPSGGNHLVFRLPPGTRVKNVVGQVGEGLDVRTGGGYILIEPSVIGGKVYDWGGEGPADVDPPPRLALADRTGQREEEDIAGWKHLREG